MVLPLATTLLPAGEGRLHLLDVKLITCQLSFLPHDGILVSCRLVRRRFLGYRLVVLAITSQIAVPHGMVLVTTLLVLVIASGVALLAVVITGAPDALVQFRHGVFVSLI